MVNHSRARGRWTRIFLFCVGYFSAIGVGATALLAQVPSPVTTEATVNEVALRPGDVIRVNVWREEDLSGDFPVNENGTVTFPLLGDMVVTEIPMNILREELLTAYRQELRNPSIYLTPLRRITIVGEVRTPNVYLVDPTVTLATAVALAGGLTTYGDFEKIRVQRQGAPVDELALPQSTLASVDLRSGDQIIVGRQGWLKRNAPTIVSSVATTGALLILNTLIGIF